MNATITLLQSPEKNLYHPVLNHDLYLTQHCMNEDLSAVNDHGLMKLRAIAAFHNWEVVILRDDETAH